MNVRMAPEFHQAIKTVAHSQRLTMQNVAEALFSEWLQAGGPKVSRFAVVDKSQAGKTYKKRAEIAERANDELKTILEERLDRIIAMAEQAVEQAGPEVPPRPPEMAIAKEDFGFG